MRRRVSFLGLGRMGSAMSANLVAAGHDVTLWNRSPEKSVRLAEKLNAKVANSPAEAVASAEFVITMLADGGALRDVFKGVGGAFESWDPDCLGIDMGTSGPDVTAWLNGELARRGSGSLDAPVSGSTASAENASLLIMVGGRPHDFERAKPVLSAMGSRVVHVGVSGSGAAMKLAVNAVIMSLGQAISEALVLAERVGISRELAYDVFENSAVAAPFVKYRRSAFLDPQGTPAAFSLNLAAKDLRLVRDLASNVGAQMPQSLVNLEVIASAIAGGYGDNDMTAVAQFLRDVAGAAQPTSSHDIYRSDTRKAPTGMPLENQSL